MFSPNCIQIRRDIFCNSSKGGGVTMEWIIYLLIIWFIFPPIFFGLLGFNLRRTKNKRLYIKQKFFSEHP